MSFAFACSEGWMENGRNCGIDGYGIMNYDVWAGPYEWTFAPLLLLCSTERMNESTVYLCSDCFER